MLNPEATNRLRGFSYVTSESIRTLLFHPRADPWARKETNVWSGRTGANERVVGKDWGKRTHGREGRGQTNKTPAEPKLTEIRAAIRLRKTPCQI